MTVMERLFARLEWQGDCLVYLGPTNLRGYGTISETVDGWSVGRLTHRMVYTYTIGEIPEAMYVLHSCDNPPCCNPEHLRVGTHDENMLDRQRRNRTRNGQADKTHCPSGHLYDEENTYRPPGDGHRQCRACTRERKRAERRRNAS
jgi:hypothetical protein